MTTIQLIVNIYHQSEPDLYTVRDEAGQKVAGFETINQLDHWLKMNGGGFLSGPKETEAGYYREVNIAAWVYRQLMGQLEKAA